MSERIGTKTELNPNSTEFASVEYQLQLALHATTARITSAFAISNPSLSQQFDRRCRQMLTLFAWIDGTHLTGVNAEDEMVRHGFQFNPSQGFKVPVGSLHPVSDKLVLCRVGIGRSYLGTEETVQQPLPEGYDSFYLLDTPEQSYYQEYLIKEPVQLLPLYIVHFSCDLQTERLSREKPLCENCEQAEASLFCQADQANLCFQCDAKLHESKLAARHHRTPIGQGTDMFGICRHHPDKTIEFYCSQCHIPVCVFCKMVGNHANGEAARHQLISVSEAYDAVVKEATKPDPMLQQRRNAIARQLNGLHERAQAVEKMAMAMQQKIDDMYREACDQLKFLVKKKMNVLMSDELELKRQAGEIHYLESFLKYQKDGDATQFLFGWARHEELLSEMRDFQHFRQQIDVQLDLSVKGQILVELEEKEPEPVIAPAAEPRIPKSPQKSVLQKIERKVQRRTSDFFNETLGLSI